MEFSRSLPKRRPSVARATLAAAFALVTFAANPVGLQAADRGAPCATRYDVRDTPASYGTSADEGLDLYVPQGRANARLLVFVHGGGWRNGRRNGYATLGYAFANCGIAVATLDYTLAPNAHADAMAMQIARATAWLERNATSYGYAKAPVFLAGHSAGAQLVAYVATLGTKVLERAGVPPGTIGGAVLLDGLFYDPPEVDPTTPMGRDLAEIFGDMTTWVARYSLKPKLTGHEPPMLVVHGTADTVVPESDSHEFYDALRGAGDAAEYLQPPDLSHSEVALQLFSQRSELFAKVVDFVGSGNP